VLMVAHARHRSGADRIAASLGSRCVGLFTTEQPQVPREVAAAATAATREQGADWVCAHGGGTAIGIAKAVALELDVKVAAIPTTYAGSERTDIWGLKDDAGKVTGRSTRVRPKLVVYDPELLVGLSPKLAAKSLLNALAHSIEALYAVRCTEASRVAARESLPFLARGLERLATSDPEAAVDGLYGSYLASTALNGASMALHHKLAHVLGGSLGVAHADAHATLLPYTFAFNAQASPMTLEATREAWGTSEPPGFLFDLLERLGLWTSLRDLGLDEADMDRVVVEVMAKRYENPRPYDGQLLRAFLQQALEGRRPVLEDGVP
jgi:maleylacetate reductase